MTDPVNHEESSEWCEECGTWTSREPHGPWWVAPITDGPVEPVDVSHWTEIGAITDDQ